MRRIKPPQSGQTLCEAAASEAAVFSAADPRDAAVCAGVASPMSCGSARDFRSHGLWRESHSGDAVKAVGKDVQQTEEDAPIHGVEAVHAPFGSARPTMTLMA